MMASTTGWMPANAASTTVRSRKRTHAHDSASVTSAAGSDERPAGREDPTVALLDVPDVHRHLRRVRSGQQVRRGHQVEEVLTVDPTPPLDDLAVHHRDVRDGPSERDDTELREQADELRPGRALRGVLRLMGSRPGSSRASGGTPGAVRTGSHTGENGGA
jgi:hypothetical protein